MNNKSTIRERRLKSYAKAEASLAYQVKIQAVKKFIN